MIRACTDSRAGRLTDADAAPSIDECPSTTVSAEYVRAIRAKCTIGKIDADGLQLVRLTQTRVADVVVRASQDRKIDNVAT